MPHLALFIKAAIIYAALAMVAVRAARTHHPFSRLGPANLVTMVRAMLTALVLASIGEPAGAALATTAVALSGTALALDGVDGWLARRTNMASAFGARFDMEVDALLILGLSVLVWWNGKAGSWVIASGLLRYLFVAAGWLLPWMQRGLEPSRRRQTICVIQMASLIAALLTAIHPPVSAWIAAASLGLLIWSFAADVTWLTRTRLKADS